MVTEKYLLRGEAEWAARQRAVATLDEILALLAAGDIRALGRALTANFFGPLQTIIPWVSNLYTETADRTRRARRSATTSGASGCSAACRAAAWVSSSPRAPREAQERLQEIMLAAKRELETALPFAMDPVVYDFAINEHGSVAALLAGADALLPAGYYQQTVPACLRQEPRDLTPRERTDMQQFTRAARARPGVRRRRCRRCSTGCCPPTRRRTPAGASTSCSRKTVLTARSTSRSAPTCATAASASR